MVRDHGWRSTVIVVAGIVVLAGVVMAVAQRFGHGNDVGRVHVGTSADRAGLSLTGALTRRNAIGRPRDSRRATLNSVQHTQTGTAAKNVQWVIGSLSIGAIAG
jgi:hypothetical protein